MRAIAHGPRMSVLRNLESKIASLVEGTFSRAFRAEVRPLELARRLTREMDANVTVSLERRYAPNEYAIYLSPQDRERLAVVEEELRPELAAHLLEHARSEGLELLTRPSVEIHTDERLALGEFGIRARVVRAAHPERPPEQGDHGHTSIYTTAERLRESRAAAPVAATPPAPAEPAAAAPRRPTALLVLDDRRLIVPADGVVVGRSRECDVVLADPDVSRRHAQLRPDADGGWTLVDLGSTNGVRVNDARIAGAHRLHSGDRLGLGATDLTFELE